MPYRIRLSISAFLLPVSFCSIFDIEKGTCVLFYLIGSRNKSSCLILSGVLCNSPYVDTLGASRIYWGFKLSVTVSVPEEMGCPALYCDQVWWESGESVPEEPTALHHPGAVRRVLQRGGVPGKRGHHHKRSLLVWHWTWLKGQSATGSVLMVALCRLKLCILKCSYWSILYYCQ